MMRAESVAVFNDESRIQAGSIPIVKEAIKLIESRKSILRRSSTLKFGVALAILGLIVISSMIVLARVLDNRDINTIHS